MSRLVAARQALRRRCAVAHLRSRLQSSSSPPPPPAASTVVAAKTTRDRPHDAAIVATASPDYLRIEPQPQQEKQPAAGDARKQAARRRQRPSAGGRARLNTKHLRGSGGKTRVTSSSPGRAAGAAGAPRSFPSLPSSPSSPSTANASSANVFVYRNTWTTFYDLAVHPDTWKPVALAENAGAKPRWRSLPVAERERIMRLEQQGVGSPGVDYAAVKTPTLRALAAAATSSSSAADPPAFHTTTTSALSPTPDGVLYDDSDDGLGGGFGANIPNVAPHAGMAPALTPQLRCQQIVHAHCLSSLDIQAVLGLLHDGLLPGMHADSSMYTELISRLCVEGNQDRARQVITEDLPRVGISVGARAKAMVDTPEERLIRMRHTSVRYLASFGMEGIRHADQLFDGLLEQGPHTVDPMLCALYLHNGLSAASQKQRIDRMVNERNVPPSAAFYVEYLGRLLIEGQDDKVHSFLSHELANLGLEHDRKRIEAALPGLVPGGGDQASQSDESLSKLRVSLIKRFSHIGEEGRDAVRQLFGTLVRRRRADTRVFNAVLRLCYTADSQEEVLRSMSGLGVRPDMVSVTTLLARMRAEGDEDAARHLFKVRLPQMHLEPDAVFLDVLNLGQAALSRNRRALMNVFSLAGDDGLAAAWRLHDKLLKTGHLDAAVARAMYNMCRGEQDYKLVSQSMLHCGSISAHDQLENEAWCSRNRPMREYFMDGGRAASASAAGAGAGASRATASSAARFFARLLRDPLLQLDA